MASWEERIKGTYRLTVEMGYNGPNGKRMKKRKTIHAKDFGKETLGTKELNKELRNFEIEVEKGHHTQLEKMTFDQLSQEWQTRFVEKQLEAKTEQTYVYVLNKRLRPYFGVIKMEKLTAFIIMDFLDTLRKEGLADSTVVKHYRILRSIFHFAKKHKVINDNPMESVEKPKEKPSKTTDVYNEKEVQLLLILLKKERPMFRVLITLAVTTGLRRGELLGLEWAHVYFDKENEDNTGYLNVIQSIPMFKNGIPVIKEPKTKNSVRKVSLPKIAIDALKDYQEFQRIGDKVVYLKHSTENNERFFLFSKSKSKPYYPKTLNELWSDFIKRNSPQLKYIRFHDLRHTAATLLILKGAHPKTISSRLGHSKISTTMDIYGHAIQSADQAAAALLDSMFDTPQHPQQA